MFDGPGFCVRPSRLWREGREAQLRKWSASVGLELRDGESYLLFESRRIDGRAEHEVTAQPTRRFFDRMWHLTPQWRRASVSLAPGRRVHEGSQHDAVISFKKAQRYVEAFYEYGTHFISALERGDVLFQVAAVRAEAAADVSGFWHAQGSARPLSGVEALPFGGLLGLRYARAVGPIVSLAGDPRLAATLLDGLWADPHSLSGTSLLQPWRSGLQRAAEQLQSFEAAAPVSIELTSLARFIEYYRAINFERILRGALLQRWGDRVALPLRRMPSIERSIARSSSGSARPACSRVLSYRRGEHSVRTEQVPLLAHVVDAPLDSQDAPTLELSTAAFEHGGLVCQTLSGVLTLVNGQLGERDVVVDGLRFAAAAPDPVAGWPRVCVRGDVHCLQPRHISALLPSLRMALAELTVTLARPLDEEQRSEAAAFVDWLAALLPARSSEPEVARLRAWALYLARVEPHLPMEHGRLPPEAQERCDSLLSDMASLALQLDELLRDHEAESWARARAPAGGHAHAERRAQTAERLRRASQQLGEHHLLLLRGLETALASAARGAALAHEQAGEQLLRRTAGVRNSGEAEGSREAAELLELFESAPSRRNWLSVDPPNPRAPRDPLAAAGLSATVREANHRGELDRLEVMERAWAAASDDGRTFENFARAEAALAGCAAPETSAVESTSATRLLLQALLLRGADPSSGREQAVDALLTSWESFESSRNYLIRTRGVLCRLRFETWLHAGVLQQRFAKDEPAGSGMPAARVSNDMELERLRILTTLGQALRWQRAGLPSLGAGSSTVPAQLDPGALGRWIIQQLRASAVAPAGRLELQMTGSYR